MFAVFDDIISKKECELLRSRIESWYHLNQSDEPDSIWKWRRRVLDITPKSLATEHISPYNRNFQLNESMEKLQEDLCKKVINILYSNLNIQTSLHSAELQIWPMNTNGPMHNHSTGGRDVTDYNSMLYLNDSFNGGEFYTENGIIIRPIVGRLTFFDGRNIRHGVNDIYDNNRCTIIFWWKNTKFK